MEEIRLVFNQIWVWCLLGLLSACASEEVSLTPAQELYTTYEAMPPVDTLHIGLDSITSGTAISFNSFLAAIDSNLLEDFIYEIDSIDGSLYALYKVSLGAKYDLCLLELRQHWFQFRYGLLFEKDRQSFTALQPLAYFYGGEGGQVFSESWLIHQETLITSEVERSIRWTPEGETQESIQTSLSAKRWSSARFRTVPVPDSTYWREKATFFQY